MPNANYVKGRRKEYKIVHKYKDEGWDIVQRTAGSHSPIDVIAINRTTRKIKFIQSKPENYHINKILEENDWLNGGWTAEFSVV